jgi:hypothetical protein
MEIDSDDKILELSREFDFFMVSNRSRTQKYEKSFAKLHFKHVSNQNKQIYKIVNTIKEVSKITFFQNNSQDLKKTKTIIYLVYFIVYYFQNDKIDTHPILEFIKNFSKIKKDGISTVHPEFSYLDFRLCNYFSSMSKIFKEMLEDLSRLKMSLNFKYGSRKAYPLLNVITLSIFLFISIKSNCSLNFCENFYQDKMFLFMLKTITIYKKSKVNLPFVSLDEGDLSLTGIKLLNFKNRSNPGYKCLIYNLSTFTQNSQIIASPRCKKLFLFTKLSNIDYEIISNLFFKVRKIKIIFLPEENHNMGVEIYEFFCFILRAKLESNSFKIQIQFTDLLFFSIKFIKGVLDVYIYSAIQLPEQIHLKCFKMISQKIKENISINIASIEAFCVGYISENILFPIVLPETINEIGIFFRFKFSNISLFGYLDSFLKRNRDFKIYSDIKYYLKHFTKVRDEPENNDSDISDDDECHNIRKRFVYKNLSRNINKHLVEDLHFDKIYLLHKFSIDDFIYFIDYIDINYICYYEMMGPNFPSLDHAFIYGIDNHQFLTEMMENIQVDKSVKNLVFKFREEFFCKVSEQFLSYMKFIFLREEKEKYVIFNCTNLPFYTIFTFRKGNPHIVNIVYKCNGSFKIEFTEDFQFYEIFENYLKILKPGIDILANLFDNTHFQIERGKIDLKLTFDSNFIFFGNYYESAEIQLLNSVHHSCADVSLHEKSFQLLFDFYSSVYKFKLIDKNLVIHFNKKDEVESFLGLFTNNYNNNHLLSNIDFLEFNYSVCSDLKLMAKFCKIFFFSFVYFKKVYFFFNISGIEPCLTLVQDILQIFVDKEPLLKLIFQMDFHYIELDYDFELTNHIPLVKLNEMIFVHSFNDYNTCENTEDKILHHFQLFDVCFRFSNNLQILLKKFRWGAKDYIAIVESADKDYKFKSRYIQNKEVIFFCFKLKCKDIIKKTILTKIFQCLAKENKAEVMEVKKGDLLNCALLSKD